MIIRFLFLISALTVSFTLTAADYSTPLGRVQDTADRVVAVLKQESLDQEARWRRIASLIYDSFDFRSMSQNVLSPHWQRATEDERRRFTEFFSQYIEATYRNRIESYNNQKFICRDELITGDRAVVNALLIAGETEIPMNFRLKNNDGNWYAYDVEIEYVSLVDSYHTTFAAIVGNEGIEGLIQNIHRRIIRYRDHGDGLTDHFAVD